MGVGTKQVGTNQYLPVISVIVPVYNVAKILERCVTSIRKQVYPNLEIILVDDGSTDMSGTFCDVFAKQDRRIKVIHQANQGLSAARNAGLEIATGKWVTFVDSDDTIRPEMIDLLHRLCYQNKTKMSICSFYEVRSEGEGGIQPASATSEKVLDTMSCLKAMLCEDGFSMSAWGKLYARELFDLVRFPEHRLYEDVGTTYKLVLQCPEISVSSVQAYNYYQTPGSITQRGFNLKKMDLIDLTDQMCDDIIEWGKTLNSSDQAELLNLTKKRRMHAHFSILRQIVMLDPPKAARPNSTNPNPATIDAKSLHHAEKIVIKYLRQHKDYVLKNPLASRRDKLAMRTLLLGKPVFRYAWQKYSTARETSRRKSRK